MSKPFDVPQDIWENALMYADELHLAEDYMHFESRKVIAKAVLAERTRCKSQVFHVAKHVKPIPKPSNTTV